MKILLTGAGFTKNFGGFLADEMWSFIFSQTNIQNNKKLRELMLKNHVGNKNIFDYEETFSEVIKSEDKNVILDFQNSILNVYKLQWNVIRSNSQKNESHEIREKVCSELLPIFRGNNNRIYTLNQDMLIEHLSKCGSFGESLNLYRPSVSLKTKNNNTEFEEIFIPSKIEAGSFKEDGTAYIKLHGSTDFKGSFDGENEYVILTGINKEKGINSSSLLLNYYENFKNDLKSEIITLLIIGYGFMDNHINQVIRDSVTQNNHGNFKIYIINPLSPRNFNERLKELKLDGIWKNIAGYYSMTLNDLLPKTAEAAETKSSSPIWEDLKKNLMD